MALHRERILISVIIPVYRVEAYIERCVRSLMEQTLDEVEYIFVDDCSPDKSVSVLERVLKDYPLRQGQTHILRHATNRGLPAARNTGLDAAIGDYIFHCDSDDYLETDALQAMYDTAQKANAEIVYSDWYLTYGTSSSSPYGGRNRYMRSPYYATSEEALRGLLHGQMKWNVWNKLVRRSIYECDNRNTNCQSRQSYSIYSRQKVRFPEGHGMGEDMTTILLFDKAHRVAYLPKGTYHYVRQNENAFTATRSEGFSDDLRFNANRVISVLQGLISDEDLAAFKLNVKFPFLISNRREDYELWQHWFPEANKYIHSHQVSKRARFLEYCAIHHLYTPLKLHYFLLEALQK